MKKTILCLFALAVLNPAYADVKTGDSHSTKLKNTNPVTIYNNMSFDVAYEMQVEGWSTIYGIQKNNVDTFHASTYDSNAIFLVSKCHALASNGGACSKYDTLKPCDSNHYNAEKIKSIKINSFKSCIVTCLDGGSSSCKRR